MTTYARSRTTKASPERVWSVWSDVSTWKDWNPNVASMSIDGPFQAGTHLVMRTRAGRVHQLTLTGVQPGRSFELLTRVAPGTNFTFVCHVQPAPEGSEISQGVRMGGPLGAILGPLSGERVAATFAELLDGLARAAEAK